MNSSRVTDDDILTQQMVINNIAVVSLFHDVFFTRLFKSSRNTFELSGAERTRQLLEGCPIRFFDQLRVDKHTFYLPAKG